MILVKLQIMLKANIYKEDWHKECEGEEAVLDLRVSDLLLQN